MATYQSNQNVKQEDTSYSSMDRDSNFESQETSQAKLRNVESDEIESRPAGQAPAFIMRVMLTSMVVFLVVIGLEVFIMHSIVGNPEADLVRRIAVLGIGCALLGGVTGMVVGFIQVMKKEFKYKSAMTIMGVILVIMMVGIAILGDNPILSQYMTE